MNVRDLFQKQYGVITDVFEAITPTVPAATITQLLKNDPGRLNYTLCNLGANALLFCRTPDPSATKGVYVAANGGYVSLDWKDDGLLITEPVYAFSTGGTTIYLVGVKIIAPTG